MARPADVPGAESRPAVDDSDLFLLGRLWKQAMNDFLLYVHTRRGADAIKLQHNTRKAYEVALRQFFYGFPELWVLWTPPRPWDVRPADAAAWRQAMLLLGRSAASLNQKSAALRVFYDYIRTAYELPASAELWPLVQAGYLHPIPEEPNKLLLWDLRRRNPFDPKLLERERIQPYERAVFPSAAEVQKILAQINRGSLVGKRDYALFYTILTTTRRISEVLNLKWGDIELSGDGRTFVFKYRYKGGVIKQARLGVDAYGAITGWLRAGGRLKTIQPEHYIFIDIRPDKNGYLADPLKPMAYATANAALKRYARRAGVDLRKAHPHALRHAGARARLEEMEKAGNVDYQKLMDVLGHQGLDVTLVYTRRALSEPPADGLAEVEARFKTTKGANDG